MFIDVHTHAFHPKIADKVVHQLENHYRIPPVGNGTLVKVYLASVDTIVSRTVLSFELKSDGLAQPTNIQFFGAVALTDTFLPTW